MPAVYLLIFLFCFPRVDLSVYSLLHFFSLDFFGFESSIPLASNCSDSDLINMTPISFAIKEERKLSVEIPFQIFERRFPVRLFLAESMTESNISDE